MKLSVCMITYNHEQFIEQAIKSIVEQQTDFPFELVIGEDESPDNTRSICERYAQKYPTKVKVLAGGKRYGMMDNFIRTLEECKGQYIAVCEGDDYWTDTKKLQKQVDFLEAHPDYSICFHDVRFKVNKKMYRNYQWDAPIDSDMTYLLRKGNYISTLAVVFRGHPGIIPFLKQFPKAPLGDYITYVAAARYGKIRFIAEKMGVYRVHEGGNWSQLGFGKAFLKSITVLDMLYDALPEEHRDDLKVQVVGMLEGLIRTGEWKLVSDQPEFMQLLKKLDITPFIVEYLRFNVAERLKSSYYSKTVSISILLKALKEKLINRAIRV